MSVNLLEEILHPQAVAIVGASGDPAASGYQFIRSLLDGGYRGRIYPVNPNYSEILGIKSHPSLRDIPGSVSYVICCISALRVPDLLEDCSQKGVKADHLFSARMSGTGRSDAIELEREILKQAERRGIRLIGPNGLGIYYPKEGLSFSCDLPKEPGSVGGIIQSGGLSAELIHLASLRGIRFSKVISYGNACDLNESDFIEYLTDDPETKVMAAYIEGIKDGARFTEVLKRAARVKPVIIYKGGITETGARMAASHTGSIAGSARIWDSLLKQVGAIQVHNIEELVDVALLFTYMSPPKGRNIAIIGVGGGVSVQAADACSNAGLAMPLLPVEIRQELRDIGMPEVGRILKNPLDVWIIGEQEIPQKVTKIVANWEQVDLLIIDIELDIVAMADVELMMAYIEAAINLGEEINKRTAIVLGATSRAESKQLALETQTALYKAGFPVYPSVSRAANAISKFIQYHQRQR